jgi:hypothetical protein
MKQAGAALILLGFLGLWFGGIPYHKTETVAQIGGLKMQANESKQLEIPPVLSGLAILAGAVMLMAGRKSPG